MSGSRPPLHPPSVLRRQLALIASSSPLPGWPGVIFALVFVMTSAGCGKKGVTAPAPVAPARWVATSGPGAIVRRLAVHGTILFAGTDQGVYRSADNGASWPTANVGLGGLDISALIVRGTNVYAGTIGDFRRTYRGLYYTINDGASWWPILPDMFVSSAEVRDTILFAGIMDGGVFRRVKGGDWDAVNTGLTDTSVHSLLVVGGGLFAGTYGGRVFRSTDDGGNWVAANNGLAGTDVSVFASLGATVFAGTNAGVFRTTDDGGTWVSVNRGLANTNVLDLAISGTSLFAATGGGGVFRTSDNGDTWTAMNDSLPGLYVSALAVGGAELFAGVGDRGVWRYRLH